jgi:hypothetical protein
LRYWVALEVLVRKQVVVYHAYLSPQHLLHINSISGNEP